MTDEKRYRLRKGTEIVGYMRKIGSQSYFYSKDSFWWTGRPISYQHVDEWIGLLDMNRIPIYEWDILKYKIDPDGPYEEGVILWENRSKCFGIQNLAEDVFIPLFLNDIQMFNDRQLQVFSYLFLNPHLMERFGLKED
ncbi:MAG: hypothetical protein LPK80_12215 [Bacteroidota bacterium]|nr:hypothetical protein [Bacteroidota bacterium]MDX5404964.1 hypothetical protein [Bacteroidota bacterium]MDX5427489.1 hypothetical protein [Bacteroidota bacterium]MDX5446771.1 hypothetical protein [Bacteroidota bacterium]MDX5505424.1 hypothetical protein [Bacteroidota bacterium]